MSLATQAIQDLGFTYAELLRRIEIILSTIAIVMSICPSCQAVNPDGYKFCQFCGSKIGGDSPVNISEDLTINSEIDASPLAVTTNIQTTPETRIQVEEIESASLKVTAEEGIPKVETSEDIPLKSEALSAATVDSPLCFEISYAAKTDVGVQREQNEDDFVAIFQSRTTQRKEQNCDRSQHGLFVLCDGMGGHEGGEEASAIAVKSIQEQFLPFWVDTLPGENKLREIIGNANQAIFEQNEIKHNQSVGRMGTTLVMLALHNHEVVIAHVGDSRIYKVTNSTVPEIVQITRDHEVCNQLLDQGIDFISAMTRVDSHQLTQALGPHSLDYINPDIQYLKLTEPTLFLLCSDGLCDRNVVEDNWRSHLLPILNGEIDVEVGMEKLIELGNQLNGHDNITAILVLVTKATFLNS
ncbi:protein phosphatase 2C domain-containing protein [Pseudanabaena mucicola]|uniref:Protein phosphatase 2C domain-containing protein n=1 Tax=Pseudanabaena mucicola FACHB-723 TaxID=2692860 RepID=A0ABR7ZWP2_9CYAN|nr:protein phosphatase 2C domain-containing protein [Pseudanabaena mucicola]MBD2188378.1 protein phosphatase 2C domain-containing protein [Pseudanabaena mucicola FACHB-723]